MGNPDEGREFTAAWLLELIDRLRPEALALRSRSDPAAQMELARISGLLAKCSRAAADAAREAQQLTLSGGSAVTARTSK